MDAADSDNVGHHQSVPHVELAFNSSNLSTWPGDILLNATVLSLNHNTLTEIPDIIESVADLSTLSAIGNDIKTISPKIGKLVKLKVLNLTENNISTLPDALCSLTCLTTLSLVGNMLSSIPDNFGELKSLKTLDLTENKLASLPKSFGGLSCLAHLDVSENRLIDLPPNFGSLNSLINLNLSNNRLVYLPDSFGQLSKLSILDLSSNRLEELPDHLQSAESITELYLDGNRIFTLPSWVGDMMSLIKFSMVENQLSENALPETFATTSTAIEHLDLSGNMITVLPSKFSCLTQLKFFDMGSPLPELERKAELINGNSLTALPHGFGALKNLVELHLDENPIKSLPEDIGGLASLEILDLNQTVLHFLPDSICELVELHTLSLAMCCMEQLPDNFGNLCKLKNLRLDQNKLMCLPDSFSKLLNLEYLDLFFNELTEFPTVLHSLTKLHSLNVEMNRFKMKLAPVIIKELQYPEKDPALANNWRGRQRADNKMPNPTVVPIHYSGSEHSSSDSGEDDVVRIPPAYITRAAERGHTSWKSHNSDLTKRPIIQRSYSPILTESLEDLSIDRDESWNTEPVVHCDDFEFEDWETPTEDNPYNTPLICHHPFDHPVYSLKHRFMPSTIHRPSFMQLFLNRQPELPEEGQFDNA